MRLKRWQNTQHVISCCSGARKLNWYFVSSNSWNLNWKNSFRLPKRSRCLTIYDPSWAVIKVIVNVELWQLKLAMTKWDLRFLKSAHRTEPNKYEATSTWITDKFIIFSWLSCGTMSHHHDQRANKKSSLISSSLVLVDNKSFFCAIIFHLIAYKRAACAFNRLHSCGISFIFSTTLLIDLNGRWTNRQSKWIVWKIMKSTFSKRREFHFHSSLHHFTFIIITSSDHHNAISHFAFISIFIIDDITNRFLNIFFCYTRCFCCHLTLDLMSQNEFTTETKKRFIKSAMYHPSVFVEHRMLSRKKFPFIGKRPSTTSKVWEPAGGSEFFS